jgi:hypothetical protein
MAMTRLATVIKHLKLFFLPKHRFIYVVLEGRLKGEWLVKVKQEKDSIIFFSLPDKHIRTVKKADFDWGIANKILEPVDVLPKSVYNVCIAEYNHKKTNVDLNNSTNRWEQHLAQDALGSK